jgi:hypothetical protein
MSEKPLPISKQWKFICDQNRELFDILHRSPSPGGYARELAVVRERLEESRVNLLSSFSTGIYACQLPPLGLIKDITDYHTKVSTWYSDPVRMKQVYVDRAKFYFTPDHCLLLLLPQDVDSFLAQLHFESDIPFEGLLIEKLHNLCRTIMALYDLLSQGPSLRFISRFSAAFLPSRWPEEVFFRLFLGKFTPMPRFSIGPLDPQTIAWLSDSSAPLPDSMPILHIFANASNAAALYSEHFAPPIPSLIHNARLGLARYLVNTFFEREDDDLCASIANGTPFAFRIDLDWKQDITWISGCVALVAASLFEDFHGLIGVFCRFLRGWFDHHVNSAFRFMGRTANPDERVRAFVDLHRFSCHSAVIGHGEKDPEFHGRLASSFAMGWLELRRNWSAVALLLFKLAIHAEIPELHEELPGDVLEHACQNRPALMPLWNIYLKPEAKTEVRTLVAAFCDVCREMRSSLATDAGELGFSAVDVIERSFTAVACRALATLVGNAQLDEADLERWNAMLRSS